MIPCHPESRLQLFRNLTRACLLREKVHGDSLVMRGRMIRWAVVALGISLALPVGHAGRVNPYSKKSKIQPGKTDSAFSVEKMEPNGRVIYSTSTIDQKYIKTDMARVNGKMTRITVQEASDKKIKVYRTRDVTVTDKKVMIKAGDDVVVAGEGNKEFQRMIKRYQKEMAQPIEAKKTDIEVGRDGVSLDDINKFSDPAETLDKQGIPVERAAGGENTKD